MPFPEDRLEAWSGPAYLTLAVDHPAREALREARRLRAENAQMQRDLADARTAAAIATRQRDEWKAQCEQLLSRVEAVAASMGAL